MSKLECGVQLYTLRRYLGDVQGVKSTFERLNKMGIRLVQLSGICDMDAKELAKIAADNQLKISSSHSPFERMVDDLDKLAEEHLIYGAEVIGIPSMPFEFRKNNFERIDEFIEKVNVIADRLKQYDLKVSYHNHNFEFNDAGGKLAMDRLIEETSPEVQFLLDTYWIQFAKQSISGYVSKVFDRITEIHLKDYKRSKILHIPSMKPVGYGTIDMLGTLALCEQAGAKYALIELDIGKDPFDLVAKSWDYLQKNYVNA